MTRMTMTSGETPLRIAVVDDDIDDLYIANVAFKKAKIPYEFVGLGSGKALFNHIEENGIDSIDILLLDVNMPAQNGHDVLEKLSTHEGFPSLCTIMVSVEQNNRDEEISGHLGAAAYIVKPYTIAEMKAFVKKVVSLFNSHNTPPKA